MKLTSFFQKLTKQIVMVMICTLIFNPAVYADFFKNHVKFKQIPEMGNNYKDVEIIPGYNYYYTGRSHLPYAVIGVDPAYELNSRFWNKIETKEMVIDKVDGLMPIDWYYMSVSKILDQKGNQVGIWYSYYPYTIVRLGEAPRMTVFSPYHPNRAL